MEFIKQNNFKIYLLIFFFLVFLFILIILLPINKNSKTTGKINNQMPTPTPVKISSAKNNTSLSPTLIPPAFTGGGELELSQEELDLSLSVQDLRKKTPLIEENFMITYDYQEDKFIVSLSGNDKISRNEFEKWRQQNYPNIPNNEFIFEN